MGQVDGLPLSVPLIEDDEDIQTLVRTRLELDGRFTVVGEASNGTDGVALARQHQPDAVVLDILMPGLDGATTLPLVRAVAPHAVVVTFSALPAEHPRVLAVGDSDGHVCKTDHALLGNSLHQACSRRREKSTQANERSA